MKTATQMPASIVKAIAAVVVARAEWEVINGVDTESKTEILNETIFNEDDSGERITNPRDDFMMTEQDFAKYISLVYARNCKKGFDSGAVGLNLWPFQKAVFDSEDALIDAVGADIPQHYTPDVIKSVKTSPQNRKKFLAIFRL